MRFTLHANMDTGRGVIHDGATERVVADTNLPHAEALVQAFEVADGRRELKGTDAESFYTLKGVSVYVTATDAKWANNAAACIYCGHAPCSWSTAECRGEALGGAPLPALTLTLPGDVVQAIVGAQAMAAIADLVTPLVREADGPMYLSDSDANEQITTSLRALIAWRAETLAALAVIEDGLTRAVLNDHASTDVENQREDIAELIRTGMPA